MNSKFWELIFTAILGFAAACLTEPVKSHFSMRTRRWEMRLALYAEVLEIYEALVFFLAHRRARFCKVYSLHDGIYHQFARKNLELYYKIPEKKAIDEIFRFVQLISEVDEESDKEAALSMASKLIAYIELSLNQGDFRKRLLRKSITDSETKRHIERIVGARANQLGSLSRSSSP